MDHGLDMRLRIGEWIVDPAAQRMSRGDEAVQLDARAFRLLLCLAGRAGEIISIGELLDLVWPGVTVSQDSVYQAMTALRRKLGDDPKRPRYIANVPRQGYRMIARVTNYGSSRSALARPRRAALAAFLVACLCLVGAAIAWGPLDPVQTQVAASQPAKVGILPFADMTDAMDQEVLVDNLTEDLIDRMSRLEALRTPSARSSFALKGRKLASIEAAQYLNVDFVVEGSVRKVAGPLLLTARLVRADTGLVIWSRTYETSVANLDAVQLDIATEVARVANDG